MLEPLPHPIRLEVLVELIKGCFVSLIDWYLLTIIDSHRQPSDL